MAAVSARPPAAAAPSPSPSPSPSIGDSDIIDSRPRRPSQRYSVVDVPGLQQQNPTGSPAAAKRALEAHLAETNRRLEEASSLGTALVQQRQALADRLRDVEQQQHEREIGPALQQKLVDVEREYHELGRDSARAFLAPRARPSSAEDSNAGDVRAFPFGGSSR